MTRTLVAYASGRCSPSRRRSPGCSTAALADDPDREALVTRTRRLTYAELDRRADRAAHALRDARRAARRPGGGVAAERRRRGGRLPRRHAPRRRVGGREPGAGAAGEALPARGLRGDAAPVRRRRCPTSACGCVDLADVAGRGRRRPTARRSASTSTRSRRPASPTRAAPPGTRRARCTASTTCSCRAPCSSRPGATDPTSARATASRSPILNMAVLTTLLVSQAGGVLDRDGPHRRRGRGRVDPRRAGHHVERPARAAPQPGDDGRGRARRPGVARRGVDRAAPTAPRRSAPRSRPSSACRCSPPTGSARRRRSWRSTPRDGSHVAGRQRPAAPAPRRAHRRRRRRDAAGGRDRRDLRRARPTTATA